LGRSISTACVTIQRRAGIYLHNNFRKRLRRVIFSAADDPMRLTAV
jgi:hypothetical protein